MLAGRCLCGFGIGLASTLVPVYIQEVSPKAISGDMGTQNQLCICLGILAALVVNVVLPATAWRQMFWVATVPAFAMAAGALAATWSVLPQSQQCSCQAA